jgi:hypothetical protein
LPRTEHDLCCFCKDKTILGKYGLDAHGNCYVHIKAWKQRVLIVETVLTSGEVHIRCRKCLRWHRISIRGRVKPMMRAEALPHAISLP